MRWIHVVSLWCCGCLCAILLCCYLMQWKDDARQIKEHSHSCFYFACKIGWEFHKHFASQTPSFVSHVQLFSGDQLMYNKMGKGSEVHRRETSHLTTAHDAVIVLRYKHILMSMLRALVAYTGTVRFHCTRKTIYIYTIMTIKA